MDTAFNISLIWQFTIKDGKKNELWTEWEENAQIKLRYYNFDKIVVEKNYQNGIKINDIVFMYRGIKVTRNYKNGQVSNEQNYLNGVLDQDIV